MESELSRVVDTLPGIVWTATPDGQIDFLNQRWREYTGVAVGVSYGRGWQSLVHPEDLPRLLAGWRDVPVSSAPVEAEARLRGSDGKYRWFLFSAYPSFGAYGQVIKWCGFSTDIDNRKTEKQDFENQFRIAIDTIPALVWAARADGSAEFLNMRWLDFTGLALDEARDWGWVNAIHPEDAKSLSDTWRTIIASGEPGEAEARLRRSDGEYRWFLFRATPLRDGTGKIVKWYGTNTDIEERKLAEQRTQQTEKQSRAAIDTIPVIVWTTLPDGTNDFHNQRLLSYTRFSPDQAQGMGWKAMFHPDDVARHLETWKNSVETGSSFECESRLRAFDGEYRWFLARAEPMRDEVGNIVKWYGTNVDIDDRKRAEALLAGEKRLLEMVAGSRPMSEILDALCRLVESTAEGCHCSVVLVNPGGTHLEHGAAPSLPASFIDSIVGRPVNIDSGPCAMAAHLNEQVVAADLASETRWAAYAWCSMAMAHGLQACWSTPIPSTGGKVLGAFAIYYTEPRSPTLQQQTLIDRFTQIASIAIERARNDVALQRSEARKSAILDAALDCIVTIDHLGRVTDFNPAAERTFGYRRQDVMGKQLANLIIPPSLRDAHQRGLARYLATGESRMIGKRVEMTAARADRSEFPVELAISRIALDGPPSFTCYLRDITERKRSEEALRRSGAYLAEAQKLSITGSFGWIVSVDEHFWSEETFRIFEYDVSTKVTSKLILDRVHPEDVPLLRRLIALAVNGQDIDCECRLLMPSGRVKHLHIVAHGTVDRAGHLEYVGAIQDVTERRLSEEALAKARSELAHVARVTSLGTLTASIAHEVNQPLAGIVTNASACLRMLDADPPNVDSARETARRIIRDCSRASDVIARLRGLFSKKAAMSHSVDLNEAAREVIALSLSELQRSRVIVRTELADDLPPVKGDRVQLQQVILNLLLNAADAMSCVENRPRHLVIKTKRDESDHVGFAVQDAGVGFEPRHAEKLFDAFYTTKSNGMGIGLSISRTIIESHQGRMWAIPNDGPGATFSFSIPCGPETVSGARDF
jgi:PAS domain S-box-containing protein